MVLDDIKKTRIRKLESLRHLGIDPYPEKTRRTHTINEALKNFSSYQKQKKEIVLVGRIRSIREHGGSAFAHIEDGGGTIQVYFKKDKLGEKAFQLFLDYFDVGDFIEVKGVFFKTKKGEKTIEVADFKMLAKSLLPLPEKWHGLKNVEERFRKRYLDLIMQEEVRVKFKLRSEIIKRIRAFLEENGFMEVETPILQTIPGGAAARPFKTHLNALNLDLYLRIAPELYLKRLLIGGYEKIYEIGRCFRNEGMDSAHNPDFTMLEVYWAYKDYKDLMKFTEGLFIYLLKEIFSKTKLEYENYKIDFKTPWQRISFNELLQKKCKINVEEIGQSGLEKEAKKLGIKIEKGATKYKLLDEIFKKVCRPKIIQPTFVIHQPIEMSPLAKASSRNPEIADRFQLIAAGIELCNAFSELNDPQEQKKRFAEQRKMRAAGDIEAQRYDIDFIGALEYGMPPAVGLGIGIDRLVVLLTNSHSLREAILFPTMRPRT